MSRPPKLDLHWKVKKPASVIGGWKYTTPKAGVFLDYSVRHFCLWAIGIRYLEGLWLPLPP